MEMRDQRALPDTHVGFAHSCHNVDLKHTFGYCDLFSFSRLSFDGIATLIALFTKM